MREEALYLRSRETPKNRDSAYLEASKIVQAALRAKYERLREPLPRFPAEPFRRWTPRANRG